MDVLETLDQDATEELQLQLKVFYENRDEEHQRRVPELVRHGPQR